MPKLTKKKLLEPEILHEDANYIVFNKPAGLVVHGDGRNTEPTLADWLLENRPEMKKVGEPLEVKTGEEGKVVTILRPGIVHRLDKDTSGAIVVAKTAKAFADLKEKFQNREVGKIYHAFIYGNLKESDGTINRPIGRSKADFRKWSAQRGARGEMREAVTHYRVLCHGDIDGAKFDFIEAEPKTGRTHQIRVHFKAIHHPVVADSLYAPGQAALLGFTRQALHAYRISFVGIDGKRILVQAPYPKDFAKAVQVLKKEGLVK